MICTVQFETDRIPILGTAIAISPVREPEEVEKHCVNMYFRNLKFPDTT
jgi:hypothetical protein